MKPSMAAPLAAEHLEGVVETVTYHNPDNGFCVLKVRVEGVRDLVPVVGHVYTVHVGEQLRAQGQWISDKSYGRQFRSTALECCPPSTLQGLERYLGSGLIRGVGPARAKQLVAAFQDKLWDVLDNAPQKIAKLSGIGKTLARQIGESWSEQKAIRDIMVFLQTYDIPIGRSLQIYQIYGTRAIDVLRTNPYQLAQDVRGIGFLSADKIALSLNIARDDPGRLTAGLYHVLREGQDEGHAGLPERDLLERAARLLGVEEKALLPLLALSLERGNLLQKNTLIFHPVLWKMEVGIATKLKEISRETSSFEIDVDKAIEWVKGRSQIALAPSQIEALRSALAHKIAIITGGPGVGKTTLVQCLLTILQHKTPNIALAAPTGRAAKRMTESTQWPASTIHKLLEYNPRLRRFRYDEETPLERDVIIVDETSMIDIQLMYALIHATPPHARLYFIGDVDQLPSVGPGQILGDLIQSGVLPVAHLTEIFRQCHQSAIILNAHCINRGIVPRLDLPQPDFEFWATETPEDGMQKLLHLVKKTPMPPQVLVPMKGGVMGTRNINVEMQKTLNPKPAASLNVGSHTFAVGDPVLQLTNNYDKDVFNGDLGVITHVDESSRSLTVRFEGRSILYEPADLDQLDLAYAMTIHKSQGSEFEQVLIPIFMAHYTLLMRNLLYTAITRGKKKVILMGQEKAISMAIGNNQDAHRWTYLRCALQEKFGMPTQSEV